MTRATKHLEEQVIKQRKMNSMKRVLSRDVMTVLTGLSPIMFLELALKKHVWEALISVAVVAMVVLVLYFKVYELEPIDDEDVNEFYAYLKLKKLSSEASIKDLLSDEEKEMGKEFRKSGLAVGLISALTTMVISITVGAILAKVQGLEHLGYIIGMMLTTVAILIGIVVIFEPGIDKLFIPNYAVKDETIELLKEVKLGLIKQEEREQVDAEKLTATIETKMRHNQLSYRLYSK